MLICTPIQDKTQKQVKKSLSDLKGKVDIAEIWLDQIMDLDIQNLLKNKPLPLICVCKKTIEKGGFKGTQFQALELLRQAVKHGADYIDLPLSGIRNPESGIRKMTKRYKTKIIISYHNFTKTPSTSGLMKKALEMKKKGADIVKIAVMAKSLADTIRVITLAKQLQSLKIPHILIAMGKKGALSRVLTPTLGGTIMFAPLSKTKSSAPGQLTISELRSAWSLLKT